MNGSFEINNGVYAHAAGAVLGTTADACHVDFLVHGVRFGVEPTLSLSDTVGSSEESGDETSFSAKTGFPVSGFLNVPETQGRGEELVRLASLPDSGQLALMDRAPFDLPRTKTRALDPGGSALVCLLGWATPSDVERRYQVLPGLYFLTARRRYCGWMLIDPIGRLRWDPLARSAAALGVTRQQTGREAAWLYEFFGLANCDTWDAIYRDEGSELHALECLGEDVYAAANSVSAWAIFQAIERALHERLMLRRRVPCLAVVRHRVNGTTYVARDPDAMATRRDPRHPVIAKRVHAAQRLLELHQDLRCSVDRPQALSRLTTNAIANRIEQDPAELRTMLAERDIAPTVEGVDTWAQFARLNEDVRRREERNTRTPGRIGLLEWLAMREQIGTHAPVKAIHDALMAMEPPGYQPTRGAPARVTAEALQHLELHIERLSREPQKALESEPTPRCIHCGFITHGVQPTAALLETERLQALGPPWR